MTLHCIHETQLLLTFSLLLQLCLICFHQCQYKNLWTYLEALLDISQFLDILIYYCLDHLARVVAKRGMKQQMEGHSLMYLYTLSLPQSLPLLASTFWSTLHLPIFLFFTNFYHPAWTEHITNLIKKIVRQIIANYSESNVITDR